MNEEMIHCPKCNLNGFQKNLMKFKNFYSCENRFCNFIKNLDEKCNDNQFLKLNLMELNFENNLKICPDCKEIGRKKVIVKRGNSYLCEDFNCFFIENCEIFDKKLLEKEEKNELNIENDEIFDKNVKIVSENDEKSNLNIEKEKTFDKIFKNKLENEDKAILNIENVEIFNESIKNPSQKEEKVNLNIENEELFDKNFKNNLENEEKTILNVENVEIFNENFKNASEKKEKVNLNIEKREFIDLKIKNKLDKEEKDELHIENVKIFNENTKNQSDKEKTANLNIENIEIINLSPDLFNNSISNIMKDKNPDIISCEDFHSVNNDIPWKVTNKIYNWTKLPCGMMVHTKIFYTLLIHLDLFLITENPLILKIKEEYNICNGFANNRIKNVKLHAFNFISKLFDVLSFISKTDLSNKEMDERIIKLIRNYFFIYDFNKTCLLKYSVKISCPFCNEMRNDTFNDYFIQLEVKKFEFKISNNVINYKVKCRACSNQLNKSITLFKVPKFIFFHCPNGNLDLLSHFDKGIVTDENINLKLVGIIECGDRLPYPDCKEVQINYLEYCRILMNSPLKRNFNVHIRNSDGWYDLNFNKSFLCSPTPKPEINNKRNVRLLILSNISDSEKYKTKITLQEFKNNREEKVNYLKRAFEKKESIAKEDITSTKKDTKVSKSKMKKRKIMKDKEIVTLQRKANTESRVNEDGHLSLLTKVTTSDYCSIEDCEIVKENPSQTSSSLFSDSIFFEIEKFSNSQSTQYNSIDYMINEIAKKMK